MSRYSLKPLPNRTDLFEVAVGWDSRHDTFFVMVFGTPDEAHEPDLRMWQGTAFHKICTTVQVLAIASNFVEVPPGLASQLEADKHRNPHHPERPHSKQLFQLFALGKV